MTTTEQKCEQMQTKHANKYLNFMQIKHGKHPISQQSIKEIQLTPAAQFLVTNHIGMSSTNRVTVRVALI